MTISNLYFSHGEKPQNVHATLPIGVVCSVRRLDFMPGDFRDIFLGLARILVLEIGNSMLPYSY